MSTKKQIRAAFRDACFKRDGYRCAICGKKADKKNPEDVLDAHHITDRSLMPNGGYVKENGISLCKSKEGGDIADLFGSCHHKAEEFHMTNGTHWITGYHPNDLYLKIRSSKEQAIAASLRLEEI
jgi:hypothetical protein